MQLEGILAIPPQFCPKSSHNSESAHPGWYQAVHGGELLYTSHTSDCSQMSIWRRLYLYAAAPGHVRHGSCQQQPVHPPCVLTHLSCARRTFVKSYLSHLGPVHTLRISGPQYCDVHALLEGFYPQSLGGAVRFACAMHGPRAAGVKGHTTLASLQRKCLRTLELTHGNLSNVPSTV